MSNRLKLVGFGMYHGIIGTSLLICMLLDHSGEYEMLYKASAVILVLMYAGREFWCDWKLVKLNK